MISSTLLLRLMQQRAKRLRGVYQKLRKKRVLIFKPNWKCVVYPRRSKDLALGAAAGIHEMKKHRKDREDA